MGSHADVSKHKSQRYSNSMAAQKVSGNLNSRPIANFHPCPWGDHFLNLNHQQVAHDEKEQEVKTLKDEIQIELLAKANEPLAQLKFIDEIQRLGLAYHFEDEIEKTLEPMFSSFQDQCHKCDLFHVSLLFRILRQHGFNVPSDVFKKFEEERGIFKESLINDIPGMLSLYEASFVRVHGDDILDEANRFTITHLKAMATSHELKSPLAEQVAHALYQPLHLGMTRLESRHYISFYEKDPSHNSTLLKLAKLDFNLLQTLHKKELSDFTRWWKSLHVKIPFSRDRSTQAYFWLLGAYYEPHYSKARNLLSKLFKTMSLVDDTYDAYGTIQELELLTAAILRWDESYIDKVPEDVKWCYQTLLETFKEVEDELAQEGRSFGLEYVKKHMKILCQAYLQEAKWCHENYVPTFDEYMEIGYVTSAEPLGIVSSFVGMGDVATKEAFEWACQTPMPRAVRALATINRLMNDMGGHKFEQVRTHVASSVQCHVMRHGAASEDDAHQVLKNKVEEAWKDLNEAMLRPFAIPKPLLDRILNLARVSDVVYKGEEDTYTIVSQAMKDKEKLLLLDSVPI